jgi:hypothetical protein
MRAEIRLRMLDFDRDFRGNIGPARKLLCFGTRNASAADRTANGGKGEMRRIVEWIRKIIVAILGEVTWVPPGWVTRIAGPIERAVNPVAALIKKRKKISIAVAVLLVAAGAAWHFRPSPSGRARHQGCQC